GGRRAEGIQTSGNVVSMQKSDDGETKRGPADIQRAVSLGKIFRRLVEKPDTLGTPERIARWPRSVRKFPAARDRTRPLGHTALKPDGTFSIVFLMSISTTALKSPPLSSNTRSCSSAEVPRSRIV